jgi:hypothetical protein
MAVDGVQLAGANECARALALLFRSSVEVGSPVALQTLPNSTVMVWCHCAVTGVFEGQVGLLLQQQDISLLGGMLSPTTPADAVVTEVVNIAASAVLNGVTRVVGGRGLPMPPQWETGAVDHIVQLNDAVWRWSAPLLGLPVPCWLVMAGSSVMVAGEQRP